MLFIKWICAHLIGDFLLQTLPMVRHKQRWKAQSWLLYLHAALHGLLIYLFTADWLLWWPPLAVAVTHFLIDWWKLNQTENTKYFVLDQCFHFLVLAVVWLLSQTDVATAKQLWHTLWNNASFWPIFMGYILLAYPISFIIGLATKHWHTELIKDFEHAKDTLADAGKWIGIFERLLVFTFIINGQFAAIGFLITAKSILRFNDTRKEKGRKEAEYILIGTLMSFALAILTGLIVVSLLPQSIH